MNEEVDKEVVERIIKIIAKANPTFKEAYEAIQKTNDLIYVQSQYVGIAPVRSDSEIANEIISVFISKSLPRVDADSILSAVAKELGQFQDRLQFSLS